MWPKATKQVSDIPVITTPIHSMSELTEILSKLNTLNEEFSDVTATFWMMCNRDAFATEIIAKTNKCNKNCSTGNWCGLFENNILELYKEKEYLTEYVLRLEAQCRRDNLIFDSNPKTAGETNHDYLIKVYEVFKINCRTSGSSMHKNCKMIGEIWVPTPQHHFSLYVFYERMLSIFFS